MLAVSAVDMYTLTLELLNKSNTSSLTPDEWMIHANAVQLEHVLSIYEKYRSNQGTLDKLQPLIEPLVIANTGAAAAGQEKFVLPYMTTPGPTTDYSYGYLRLLNISFKLNYKGNACYADGVGLEYESATLLDDDQETIIKDNPYRKAKDSRLYYQQTNNEVTVKTGTQSYATEAKIRFLRYPRQIDLTQSPGIGDCELPIDVRNDICHLIAKKVIEEFESGRYPSLSNEVNQQINS
jgi:hypothetical protein